MRLTVIGCSGSYPGPDSPASCYLLEEEHQGRTWRILLDLGNGALGALQRHVDPLTIDAVLLSHLHADHCLDLCGYYVLRRYHPAGAAPRIPVWGPQGTADRLAAAYDLPPEPGMREEFDFHVYDAAAVRIGPFEVRATPVSHPVSAFALRVRSGERALTYSGDTSACESLVRAAADVDLFLVEASFAEDEPNPPGIHLTGREAGQLAARAGAKRVLLTHVPPWHNPADRLAEARSHLDVPLDIARPGHSYEV